MVSLRKLFSIAIFLAIANSAVSQDSSPVEVADGIYSYGMGNYISMFVVTDEAVIAIDPINPTHSQALVAAIKSVTDQPIRYLVHTHNHWDHSGGGQAFKDEGATIIAHVDAYNWMRANPHPNLVLPDESWGGGRKDIVLGGTTVELHHFGASHGHGMTIPLASTSQRVGYIADIVGPNRLPFLFLPDFNVAQLERTLGEILELDIDKIVFTHSQAPEPLQGGTKQDVADTLQYLRDLRAELDSGIHPTAVSLPKYESWRMYDEWLPLNAWKIFMEGHLGPF